MSLNKQSPIPLYYQLAEIIREQIRTGELKAGDQLPPERLLSERYQISRMTARQALGYLLREGTLVTEHGRGTFVAAPKLTYDAFHLLGFSEEIVHHGGQAVSRVLEQRVQAATAQVARELGLVQGAAVVQIARLRLADTTPLLLETTYVPAALCPGLEREDLVGQSLYRLLEERYGITLARARQTLEATIANEYESGLFGIVQGTPMILLEGVTRDDTERPVEYFKAIYRGDRFKFSYESERSIAAGSSVVPRLSIVLA
jgi:GntR family transcriptional regulator